MKLCLQNLWQGTPCTQALPNRTEGGNEPRYMYIQVIFFMLHHIVFVMCTRMQCYVLLGVLQTLLNAVLYCWKVGVYLYLYVLLYNMMYQRHSQSFTTATVPRVGVALLVLQAVMIATACLTKSSNLLSTVNVQVHVHSNLSFLAAGHTQDKINLCSSDKDSEAHDCVRSHVRI